jgi:hypothetical protein
MYATVAEKSVSFCQPNNKKKDHQQHARREQHAVLLFVEKERTDAFSWYLRCCLYGHIDCSLIAPCCMAAKGIDESAFRDDSTPALGHHPLRVGDRALAEGARLPTSSRPMTAVIAPVLQ